MLRHIECKGNVVLLLSGQLQIVSPGMKIDETGISPGVSELQKIGKSSCAFICTKCGEVFSGKDEISNLEIECVTCGEHKPVSEILVSPQGLFCNHCHEILSPDYKGDLDDYFKRLKEVISISRGKKVILSELMLKPIKV